MSEYQRQVELLIKVLPSVAEERVFALHGGTAINLFVRDMPRLSVDVDLTYLPIEDRTETLANIGFALERIENGIRRSLKSVHLIYGKYRSKASMTTRLRFIPFSWA